MTTLHMLMLCSAILDSALSRCRWHKNNVHMQRASAAGVNSDVTGYGQTMCFMLRRAWPLRL